METVMIGIDKELIEEALSIQREQREFFDEDISNDEIDHLINQIIADHLQDIEDTRSIQRVKQDPEWKKKCTIL